MNKLFKLSSALVLTIVLFSCGSNLTITKKSYSPGYNIDWNRGNSNADEKKAIAAKQAKKTDKLLAQTKPLAIAETPLSANYLPNTNNIILPLSSLNLANTPATVDTENAIKKSVTETINNSNFKENKVSGAKKFIIKKALKKLTKNKSAETDQFILIVLALLIPPLAVYLYEGNEWTSRCTINLILTFLCGLPGVIHALIVILGNK